MFRQAVLRLYRAHIGSDLNRYVTLPPLANFVTLTGGAANVHGVAAVIDDGTGTAATGAYDGEAWVAGIVVANPSIANQYYEVQCLIAGVWAFCVPTHSETTVVADHMEVIWLPNPIHIGVAPAALTCSVAEATGAGTIDVKLIIEQGL